MMRWMAPRLLAAGILLVALPASADMFQHHTSQSDIEQRIVERPLVVGKGWVEVGLGLDWKHTSSEFLAGDGGGSFGFTKGTHYEDYSNNARLNFRRFTLMGRWGFTKGTDLYVRIPFVWNHLANDNEMIIETGDGEETRSTSVNTFAIGDVEMGVLIQWLRRQDPNGKFNSSLGSHIDIKAPTGLESPGSYIASPGLVTVMPTGTGTYNWGLDIEYKQQLAFMAVDVRAGFVWRTSGIAQYLIEDQENQFQMRIKPGDAVEWDIDLVFQPARFLALGVGLASEYRFATKVGPSSRSMAQCKECEPIADSEGLMMNGAFLVSITPSRSFQVDLRAEYTLAGLPAFMIPLEDVSPTRGVTVGANVLYRF